MRRQNKNIDLQALKKRLDDSDSEAFTQWESYSCKLVTPMYGGGVNAGEVDKNMPIRASSIRGHLRFWWRIACGPSDDPKTMLEKEEAIWGGIGSGSAKASRVEIRVVCKPLPININQLESSKSMKGAGVKYILGAAGETDCLTSGYKFDLKIHYKNGMTKERKEQVQAQVKESLRWWASFGGIGGRTRRGFGAVTIDELEPIVKSEVMARYGKLELTQQLSNSAEDAWKKATESLYKFRQGTDIGRNEGHGNRPGRSRWPEPDQLRRMSNKHKANHEPEHAAGNVFPRAAFGMPIIFDFNDRSKTEPNTMTLLPAGALRMASPLIIRPYKNGAQWQAAALLLPNWQAALREPLELSPSPRNSTPNHWPSSENERNTLAKAITPMKMNKDGQIRADDPLSAFLDFFEKGQ